VLDPPAHATRVGTTDWIQAQLGFPDIPPSLVPLDKFSLHGELMHAFVSYRVATEGVAKTEFCIDLRP
jgi:hypothetical protein